MDYINRLADSELDLALESMGGVLVEGLMGVGKSELCKQRAKRVVNLQISPNDRQLVDTAPEILLSGPYPTLIDEWQASPNIWNQVRDAIDSTRQKGRFLLTGSATPDYDKTRHPGITRIGRLRLRPFSMVEAQESDGSVSIRQLFAGKQADVLDGRRVQSIGPALDAILKGGLPGNLGEPILVAQRSMRNYVNQIPLLQMPLIAAEKRSPLVMEALLQSLARRLGSELKIAAITRDMAELGIQVAETTVAEYVAILERLFIVEKVPAWFTHLRSKTRLTKGNKLYFADPSMAAALLGAGRESLLGDLETTGFLFENLVHRDLSVFMDLMDGRILHYRDAANLEADFILRLQDGRWAPIEVKLGASRAQQGIENLEKLVAKLDPSQTKEPTFKAVITTGEHSYQDKKTGTWVISIYNLGF